MAVENVKSNIITRRDNNQKSVATVDDGMLREQAATVEIPVADANSTIRMVTVQSNCRVSQIILFSDDSGTTGAFNLGLYQTTLNGGAVIDADFFATAVDIATAAQNALDITHEAGTTNNIADLDKPLWKALGLEKDPGGQFDIVATLTAATTAIATLSLKVRYVI